MSSGHSRAANPTGKPPKMTLWESMCWIGNALSLLFQPHMLIWYMFCAVVTPRGQPITVNLAHVNVRQGLQDTWSHQRDVPRARPGGMRIGIVQGTNGGSLGWVSNDREDDDVDTAAGPSARANRTDYSYNDELEVEIEHDAANAPSLSKSHKARTSVRRMLGKFGKASPKGNDGGLDGGMEVEKVAGSSKWASVRGMIKAKTSKGKVRGN